MTTAEPANGVVYDLEGTLLEACSCGVLCPCWVGADPDGGACDPTGPGPAGHRDHPATRRPRPLQAPGGVR